MKALVLLCLFSVIPQTDQTFELIFRDRTESVAVEQARSEFAELQIKPVLTESENSRFVALVEALGTDPTYCTEGQIDAGLCLPHFGPPEGGKQ